jgi:hypothetical protein
MAKRSIVERYDQLEEIEEDKILDELPEEPEIEYVTLVLMKPLILNYTGAITGKLYVFNGAGSSLPVDKRDADKMLMKKSNLPCCSGSMQTPYFSILKG